MKTLNNWTKIAIPVCILTAAIIIAMVLKPDFWGEYYVSPDGSDTNPGSYDRPFATIQKAADVLGPGEICYVNPGIYYETVTPKNSGTKDKPITFKAAQANTVTINGAKQLSGWEKYKDSIYQTKVKLNLRKNNQLFYNGQPLHEARWPNDTSGDLMKPAAAEISGGESDHLVCKNFPDNWQKEELTGAVLWAMAGSKWSSWSRTITKYDPKTKAVYFPDTKDSWWIASRHNPVNGGKFYLIGAMKLLDAPGEWFYDQKNQILYLWPPENEDPNKHQVTGKDRMLGFDLQEKSWITLDGINLMGCSMDLRQAEHCLINNIKAKYISHTRGGETMSRLNEKSGIYVSGNFNRIANSEIAYSAGNGVSLQGQDNAVVNCWIHHISYFGSYCSPIYMGGLRHLVSHNTIEKTGRDCIKLGGAEHLIQYNDIGFPGQICHDLGAVYSGGLDGGNTRIYRNFVHDNPGGVANVGIYLDNYMKNYMVRENVVWKTGNSIRLNRPSGFCMAIDNWVFEDINNSWGPWKGQKTQWGCYVIGNRCGRGIYLNPEVVMSANHINEPMQQYFDIKTRRFKDNAPAKPTWQPGHDFENPPTVNYQSSGERLRNYIKNAAFEYGTYEKLSEDDQSIRPLYWQKTGEKTARVEHHSGFNSPPAQARNSIHNNSVTLDGDANNGIMQTVNGLEPDTEYYFSGYVRHPEDGNVALEVWINGKKTASAQSQHVQLGENQAWRLVIVKFKTGQTDTSAQVKITKTKPAKAYIDNTGIVPADYQDNDLKELYH